MRFYINNHNVTSEKNLWSLKKLWTLAHNNYLTTDTTIFINNTLTKPEYYVIRGREEIIYFHDTYTPGCALINKNIVWCPSKKQLREKPENLKTCPEILTINYNRPFTTLAINHPCIENVRVIENSRVVNVSGEYYRDGVTILDVPFYQGAPHSIAQNTVLDNALLRGCAYLTYNTPKISIVDCVYDLSDDSFTYWGEHPEATFQLADTIYSYFKKQDTQAS